jgi:hypothetical protein
MPYIQSILIQFNLGSRNLGAETITADQNISPFLRYINYQGARNCDVEKHENISQRKHRRFWISRVTLSIARHAELLVWPNFISLDDWNIRSCAIDVRFNHSILLTTYSWNIPSKSQHPENYTLEHIFVHAPCGWLY